MQKIRSLCHAPWCRIPAGCLLAALAGFALTTGQVCGEVSPLAAVLTGVCPPFYGLFILAGAMLACIFMVPEGMYFALAALVCVLSMRILFYELRRPHVLAVLSAVAGVAGGAAVEFVFQAQHGRFPLFVLESLVIGAAVYFLSDAARCLKEARCIVLGAGSSFTFAMTMLLSVTALCGIDTPWLNVGRLLGMTAVLIAARQFGQTGGTLCGALCTCGAALCSIQLGQPLLFLPITAMLAGFLHKLPQPLFLSVFFVMQLMSAAVLDGSQELVRLVIELILACMLHGFCPHDALLRWIRVQSAENASGRAVEPMLMHTIDAIRQDTRALLSHLPASAPPKAAETLRRSVCSTCKNADFCWTQRAESTAAAFEQLLHHPAAHLPAELDSCIHAPRLREACAEYARKSAVHRCSDAALAGSRSRLLLSMDVLSGVTAGMAAKRSLPVCESETALLRRIAASCGCQDARCTVHRLRSGRIAAELIAKDPAEAAPVIAMLLGEALHADLRVLPPMPAGQGSLLQFYEAPPFTLECAVESRSAGGKGRCGDASAQFTDAHGDSWLILSDGMGSGNAAALSARLTVRSFSRLIRSGMDPDSAVRLLHLLLSGLLDEQSATLDVLRLDGDTGTVTLLKCGAPPTLHVHGGRVRRLSGDAFPLGVLPDCVPVQHTLTAVSGDCLIMTSDGIPEGVADGLAAAAAGAKKQNEDLSCIAANALAAAPLRDDCTAAVIRICTAADGHGSHDVPTQKQKYAIC